MPDATQQIMTEVEATPRRFACKLTIGDAIAIAVKYEYSKLIRHLRDHAIWRVFRSQDKQGGKLTFDEMRQEFAGKLVVLEHDVSEARISRRK